MRLQAAVITVRAVDADPELAVERILEGSVSLIGDVWTATTRLDLTTHREWGALKASTSLKVEIGRWPARQVHAGRCTWLDLDLLRALGPGLASRTWAGIEGWARWPQQSFDGRQETASGLGTPALESLGVAKYARSIDARRALNRAGQRIVAVDPAYEMVRCERRAGWCLIVRRLTGSACASASSARGILAFFGNRGKQAAARGTLSDPPANPREPEMRVPTCGGPGRWWRVAS